MSLVSLWLTNNYYKQTKVLQYHEIYSRLNTAPFLFQIKRAQCHHGTTEGPTSPVRASGPDASRPRIATPPSPTSPPTAQTRRPLAPQPHAGPCESDRLTDIPTPHNITPHVILSLDPRSRVRHTRPQPRTPTRSGASAYMNAHLSGEFRPTTQNPKQPAYIKKEKNNKKKKTPAASNRREEEGGSLLQFSFACASRLRACDRRRGGRGRSHHPDPMAFMRSHVSTPLHPLVDPLMVCGDSCALWCRSVWRVGTGSVPPPCDLGAVVRGGLPGLDLLGGGIDLALPTVHQDVHLFVTAIMCIASSPISTHVYL
jgi:hypothetical protein